MNRKHIRTKSISFLGTGSGVGKSLVVAAVCRILWKMGIKVAPFKAQNMALNSFVTLDGKEMGRAQVYQAEACGLKPDVRMNPILLKPSADARSQVIIMGRPKGELKAKQYYSYYQEHLKVVRQAYDSLSEEYECIVIEGAGSPAEINLQKTDLVNMQMAKYANAPVVLIGDIDRGGVFAWLKGTYDLVGKEHQDRIKAFLINKFRGDISLLKPGLKQFEQIIPVPFLGVLPWLNDLKIDQEDGVFLNEIEKNNLDADIKIAIVRLGRISNFTDFVAFLVEPDVSIKIVNYPYEAQDSDVIIIPGSKATISDYKQLEGLGWKEFLHNAAFQGKIIFGICGGYQMLGEIIEDPNGVEGIKDKVKALGLLPLKTIIKTHKHLCQKEAEVDSLSIFPNISADILSTNRFIKVKGYEIHMGESILMDQQDNIVPLFKDFNEELGVLKISPCIIGTYLHGIFDSDLFRRRFLDFIRIKKGLKPIVNISSFSDFREAQFDILADWFRENVDINMLLKLIGIS